MRRKPLVCTSSAAESTKVYRPCSSRLTAQSQWAAILGRPRLTAASPCWNCLRATRLSRGLRASPRPVVAIKSCASSGSIRNPEGHTDAYTCSIHGRELGCLWTVSARRQHDAQRLSASRDRAVDQHVDRLRLSPCQRLSLVEADRRAVEARCTVSRHSGCPERGQRIYWPWALS